MGRNPKTTAALEASGAFDKNPQRFAAREDEPKPTGPLGLPPKSFERSPMLLELWEEIVSMCPPNVLTVADRWLVENLCELMYLVRTKRAKSGDRSLLLTGLGKLGMTPLDRPRVKAPGDEKKKDGGDWDEIEDAVLARRGHAGQPN